MCQETLKKNLFVPNHANRVPRIVLTLACRSVAAPLRSPDHLGARKAARSCQWFAGFARALNTRTGLVFA